MPKASHSRRGSLAFRPRKRASTFNGRIRNWPECKRPVLLGFAGYKAGMLRFFYNEEDPNSPNKGKEVSCAGTLVEVPPLFVYGIRAYRNTLYGRKLIGDFFMKDASVNKIAKIKGGRPVEELGNEKDISDVHALAITSPKSTTTGKKSPERIELGVGGDDVKKKIEYVKGLLGKEVQASDVFEKGAYVDVISVTKGKGWQGVVKRFGISIQRRKATGKRRHVGNLGSWHPAIVEYTALHAGQMGLHKRTILNNLIVDIGDASKLKQDGGLLSYGVVRNKYMILKGSVPGPKKRLIKMRLALRKPESKKEMKVAYLSRAI